MRTLRASSLICAALACAVLLVPQGAIAGWVQQPFVATPNDVQAIDGGVIVVAVPTASGTASAWSVQPDGGSTLLAQTSTGPFVSASLVSPSCLVGMTGARGLVYSPACAGVGGALFGTTALRIRIGPSGTGYALTANGSALAFFVSPTPTIAASYLPSAATPSGSTLLAFEHLSVLSLGGAEYAVFETTQGGATAYLSIDGGTPVGLPLSSPLQSVCTYASGNTPKLMVVTSGTGQLLDVSNLAVPAPTSSAVAIPSPFKPSQVAFTLAGGNAFGSGFGLLSSADGGVASPIPDPASPGQSWIPRTGAPVLTGIVSCADSSFCAAAGPGVVYVYFNESPPYVSLPPISLADGTAVDLTADAGDLDGDPIFISWASDGGATLTTDGGEQRGLRLSVPAGLATCSNVSFSLLATVSDGYAPHANTVAIPVTVTRTGAVTAPIITPSAPTVSPGSAPLAFNGSTSNGCPPSTWTWNSSTGQVGAAQSFNWTVPSLSCTPDGGTEWVELTASDAVSTAGPTRVNVRVLPTATISPPSVSPSAPTVAAGGGAISLTATPGVGCPPSSYTWSASDSTSGAGPTFSFTPPALLCSADAGAAWVDVFDSDGTRTSSTVRTNITIIPTGSLVTPTIAPPSAAATPGSAPITFSASSSGGCPPSTWTWTSSENASGSGTSFAWTPPASSCTVDGGVSWVQVVASDGTRTSSAVRANIAVAPTTTMPPPTIAPASPTLAAGSGPVVFTATAGGGCPPTTFSWTASDSTSGSGPTFTFTPPALVCTADAGAAWVEVQDSDGTRTSPKVRTPITITPNPTIATPVIAPAAPTVTAGGPPITFSSSASGGCPATSWTWTGTDGTSSSTQSFAWTPPSGSCEPDGGTVTIQLVASNGLAWSAPAQAVVRVLPNGQLPKPIVTHTVSDAGYLFTASTSGSCQPTYAWVTSDGFSGAGPTFAWAPPAHSCIADAGVVTISVRGSLGASVSASSDTTVSIDPWGAPEAPVFDGGTQPAGSTQEWLAGGPTHFCAGRSGFQGTEIVWLSLDAGGPGIDLVPIDGGLLIASLDACASNVVTGTAVRTVANAASAPSGPGELVVQLVPDRPDITSVDQLAFTVLPDSGVRGTFTVDAGCLAGRELEAFVSVDGGGFGCSGPVALGSWALPSCQLSCESATYDVTATLRQDGGATLSTTASFELKGATASITSVAAAPMRLACGQRPSTELSAVLEGQCGLPTLSFQASTPGTMSLTGPTSAHFVTDTTGYELLGRRVTVTATPDNGTSSQSTELVFETEPFLAMTTRLTQLPAREEEAAVVTVDVANGTSCDVAGVDLRVDLGGLVPIAGSLTLDGAPREFTAQSGQLVVTGIDVAAKHGHQLRFKAHVVMLSRTRAEPHASIGTVEVGFVPEQPTGCGCTTATPGLEWLSALALIAWVRSRRRAC